MTRTNYEPGCEVGEACGRNGCSGIIEEHEKESCCSCHINPPCASCTTLREFCPECDWDAEVEMQQEARKRAEEDRAYWAAWRERERWKVGHFDPSLPFIIAKSHTHFSMIKEGVIPNSMEKEALLERVRGTFGGRFERWDVGLTHTRFRYIAYTD